MGESQGGESKMKRNSLLLIVAAAASLVMLGSVSVQAKSGIHAPGTGVEASLEPRSRTERRRCGVWQCRSDNGNRSATALYTSGIDSDWHTRRSPVHVAGHVEHGFVDPAQPFKLKNGNSQWLEGPKKGPFFYPAQKGRVEQQTFTKYEFRSWEQSKTARCGLVHDIVLTDYK